eukprot:jgi/Botrbrau1/21189/Bobra.0061s0080.1
MTGNVCVLKAHLFSMTGNVLHSFIHSLFHGHTVTLRKIPVLNRVESRRNETESRRKKIPRDSRAPNAVGAFRTKT